MFLDFSGLNVSKTEVNFWLGRHHSGSTQFRSVGDDEVFTNTDEGRGEPSKKAQNPVDVGDVDKGYISMLTF